MSAGIKNIHGAAYEQADNPRGDTFRFLDLSGEHLGVRIEEISPGGTTSYHHYHSCEEEHVLILEGAATLYLGDDEMPLTAGDHVCFQAGVTTAHHIGNTTDAPLRLLVFGERKEQEVVFYPDAAVMLVKSGAGVQRYRYEQSEAK